MCVKSKWFKTFIAIFQSLYTQLWHGDYNTNHQVTLI